MAPLVPGIISEELNFLMAFIIGIGFGFILEQAGFSSSRKLAGLFYGKDFTVLRVFFTAAITSSIGLALLGYFGLLDLEMIYINPTYLGSAIVGGVFMGIGFVIGGFCPGTSICAAAIGKIDAMAFIGGAFIGVFSFAESFSLYEGFYKSGFLGYLKVNDSLGMSSGLFAFLLIIVAIATFIGTTIIENKVNKTTAEPKNVVLRKYGLAIGVALLFGLVLLFLPEREEQMLAGTSDKEFISEQQFEYVTSDELAYRLIDNDRSVQLIDVRNIVDFKKFNLPTSVNIPLDSLLIEEWSDYIEENRTIIFCCQNEEQSQKAIIISQRLGFEDNYVLKGGIDEFNKLIMHVADKTEPKTKQEDADYRFRSKAVIKIKELIEIQKNRKDVVKPKKRKATKGGC